jgi:K+-transporting ATPase KdpF subunit
MMWDYTVGLLVSLLVTAYLVYSLIHPEKF